MAETLLMASTAVPNQALAGETWYLTAAGWINGFATETNGNMPLYTTGRLSNFLALVGDNSASGTTTITLRKNGASTSIAVSIPAGTTGEFTDDVDDTTIASGDLICYRYSVAAGSGLVGTRVIRCIFSPDQDTVTKQNSVTPGSAANYNSASTTYFGILCGSIEAISVTEASVKSEQVVAGQYKYLAVNVSDNDRTTTTTVRLRVNGANSSLTTSIGAGLTGWFEDTSNTVSVTEIDDVNYSIVNGTGTENMIIRSISCEFINTDSRGLYTAGNMGVTTEPAGTNYWPIMGLLAYTTSEGNIAIDSGLKQVDWIDFACTVAQNNLDSATTLTVRNNRANTDMSISIPANTTGQFSDITESQTSSFPPDEINMRITTGTGGVGDTITLTSTTISAFIIPFKGQQSLSMSASTPQFADYHHYNQQSNFFGSFSSPMFGD